MPRSSVEPLAGARSHLDPNSLSDSVRLLHAERQLAGELAPCLLEGTKNMKMVQARATVRARVEAVGVAAAKVEANE